MTTLPPQAAGRPNRGGWVGTACLLVPGALALLGLLWYAGLGSKVRPASDDWCFSAWVHDKGYLGYVSYEFDVKNGRLSNAIVAGLVYLRPLAEIRVFPALLTALAVVSVGLLCRELVLAAGVRLPALETLSLAVVLVATQVLFVGDTYQSWFWAPGAVSHTLPPVLGLAAAAGILFAIRRPRFRRWALWLALPVGYALGMFNEAFPLLAVVACLTVVAGHRWYVRRRSFVRRCLTLLAAGLVAGLVTVLLSPGSTERQSHYRRSFALGPKMLGSSLADTFRLAGFYLGEWQIYLVLLLGLVVGIRYAGRWRLPAGARSVPRRWWWLTPLILSAVSFFLCVYSLRYAEGPDGPNFLRVYANAFIPFCVVLGYLGVLAGVRVQPLLARRSADARVLGVLAAISVALTAGIAASVTPWTTTLSTVLSEHQAAWNAENRSIDQKRAQGATVVTFVPHYIAGLGEPFDKPQGKDVPRTCVAEYYHLRAIHHPSWLVPGQFVRPPDPLDRGVDIGGPGAHTNPS